jgi:hypothetical protein
MQPTEADPTPTRVTLLKVDAYKRMGQIFVGPGLGVVYAIKPNMGVQLNVDAKILLHDRLRRLPVPRLRLRAVARAGGGPSGRRGLP